ncbi:MAG: metallophosphoesterase [Paludibacter sp.]|nr:metallophosphoesterase [Bacteroidales bacterium]MCM1069558.1 metallophosphoesterase [Prevotella sp.]MCM1354204.1 metallophosphoesterase [Bacteroides sp.]MCM1443057.1 metallophosphoesterase [Muribaculum sp.]MCM1482278.1 metallophosphoesterase [Paludibacter sp.]
MMFYLFIGLLVFILGVVYLARRTAFCFGVRPMWFYVGYTAVFLLSFTLMWLARLPFAAHVFTHMVCVVATSLVTLLMCLLVGFLFTDILHCFVRFTPRMFSVLVGVLTLGLFLYGTCNAALPRVKTVSLQLSEMSAPLRLVQLTDVHIGQFRGQRHLQHLVDVTNSLQPDIVVITGDLFDAWYNCSENTLQPLAQLQAPVYFVEGNHDIYVDSPRIKQMLRKVGVRVLENEVVVEHGVQLIGLDYLAADRNTKDNMHVPERNETIQSVLASLFVDKDMPAIGLHHNPVGAQYFEAAGVELYLAGHTHGGQFYPLVWLNDRGFVYNRGLDKYKNMYVYVSCGSGTTGPAFRIGTSPEITLFLLQ